MKKEMLIIADYSDETPLTFDEIAELGGISRDFINELIEYGVIHPAGETSDEWVFEMWHLQRIKMADRLHRELEVNLAGVALALDLLDDLETLRARVDLLEKHLLR